VLIGNGALVHRQLCRQIGGGLAGDIYAWGRTERYNRFTGGVDRLSGAMPGGHLAPSAWVLPKTAGGMSSFIGTTITVSTGTLTLAAGRNLDGTAAVTVSAGTADLQLIVSASGTATLTITVTGTLAGALSATGTASITCTVPTATLGAIVNATGTAAITGSTSATLRALGWMTGSSEETTDLTADAIAAAVWAQAVDAGLTADDVLRILLAVAAGETTITSGASPVVTFKTPDGTEDRLVATMDGSERTAVVLTP